MAEIVRDSRKTTRGKHPSEITRQILSFDDEKNTSDPDPDPDPRINTNQPSPRGRSSRLLHPSTVASLEEGRRRMEGKKERKKGRKEGKKKGGETSGRDLGSPFSRIHAARFLSRSPSPHPRPGSWPRGGGWRPPTETPFLPPLTHMPRRTCNMCTRMHVHPSRGTGFSVCECARARATERQGGGGGGGVVTLFVVLSALC